FGRVFLAQQDDLANRSVALKVSAEIRSESQALAQLQHTHIVPIYSIHQAGPLQAVCMPYYGSTTLLDVLQEFHGRGALPDSGKGLVDTLRDHRARTQGKDGASPAADASVTSPAKEVSASWKTLEGLSYVHAILWIASKLADGLA